MPTTEAVACPKCGGPMWDNKLTKRNDKAPDFKCRDRSCDGVIWPPRNGAAPAPAPARAAAPAPAATTKAPHSAAGPLPWEGDATDVPADALPHEKLDRLFALYRVCYAQAMETVSKTFAHDEPSQVAVTAATATLFIAAKERGIGT